MRRVLTSPHLPAPRFRYSQIVQTGPFFHFAGMVGLDKDTGGLVSGGPGAETEQILDNMIRALPDLRLTLDHLVHVTIYTTAFDAFAEINRAWDAVFDANTTPPARTAAGVSRLPLDASVEMVFQFYKAGA